MMDVIPAPPGFLTGIELTGPYDADIPAARVNQLKSAGLKADWAVPYIFLSIASRFESEGDEKRSLAFYDRSIREFHKRNNATGEGMAWCRKMAALQRFGNGAAAFKAIAGMEALTSGGISSSFVSYSLGHYYLENGNYARALEYLRHALELNSVFAEKIDLIALRRDTELEYGMALILDDYFPAVAGRLVVADFDETFYRGIRRRAALSLSHLEKAHQLHTELVHETASAYFPEISPAYGECDIYNYTGLALGIQGDFDQALRRLEKAGALAKQSGYHLGKADGIFFLNQVYILNNHRTEGWQAAYSLDNIGDQYHILPYAVWAKILLAHYARQSGDVDAALKFIRDFLALMENNKFWLNQVSDFRQTGHFSSRAIRTFMFDLFIQKGDVQNAFKTAEEIKTTSLAKAFNTGAWGDQSIEGPLLGTMRLNNEHAAAVYRRLLSVANTSSVFLKTAQSAGRIQKDISNFATAMKNQYGSLYGLMYLDPPDARDIQLDLDRNTTLFSYYSTTEILYVWVISQNGIHMEKIRMSGAAVEKFVSDYHQALMAEDRPLIDNLSEKAYDIFLKPVIPFIHGDRIIFIPHDALSGFPYAAMRYMQSYLVDVFNISYLPDLNAIQMQGLKTTTGGLKKSLYISGATTVSGDSSVQTDKAFETLRHLYPMMDVVTPPENSKNAILKRSGNFDMISFAAECRLVDHSPLTSGFLLSSADGDDGYLTVCDLIRLTVRGRVAVISSCLRENASPSSHAGQSALSQALLYSSVPAVIMPLWNVNAKPKAVFMEAFYKHFEKNDDAADALKMTQNDMIRAGVSPADWAAFVLFSRY